MTGRYYHTAPKTPSSRIRCEVCQQEVYSSAGIHPQCAIRRDDPSRLRSKSAKATAQPMIATQPD